MICIINIILCISCVKHYVAVSSYLYHLDEQYYIIIPNLLSISCNKINQSFHYLGTLPIGLCQICSFFLPKILCSNSHTFTYFSLTLYRLCSKRFSLFSIQNTLKYTQIHSNILKYTQIHYVRDYIRKQKYVLIHRQKE